MNRILLFFFLFATASPVLADKSYYDQQEEIRRAANRLVEHDRQQREEAANRYEERNRSSSNIGTSSTFLVLKWLVIGIFWLFVLLIGGAIVYMGWAILVHVGKEIFCHKNGLEDPKLQSNEFQTGQKMSKKELKIYRKALINAHTQRLNNPEFVEAPIPKPPSTGFSIGSATNNR